MAYTLECKHSIESEFFDFQTVPMGDQGQQWGELSVAILDGEGRGGGVMAEADVE